LGIGGLGSVVLMNVLRLGVKKTIIVDYDVVDTHNLNRQIMYSLEDVGKSKIDCALKNSKHHNIGNTEIVGHCLDAVKNWNKII
jgi:molybdopterin/thiamine biosynthesis adenylyltransferase